MPSVIGTPLRADTRNEAASHGWVPRAREEVPPVGVHEGAGAGLDYRGSKAPGAATAIGGARCIRFGRLCAVVAGMQKLSTAGGDEGSVALPAAGRGRSCASIFGGFVRI